MEQLTRGTIEMNIEKVVEKVLAEWSEHMGTSLHVYWHQIVETIDSRYDGLSDETLDLIKQETLSQLADARYKELTAQ